MQLVAIAEELGVGAGVGPERMKHDLRGHITVSLVVEPALVRGQVDVAVAGRRQRVVEVLTGIHVTQVNRDLVDPAVAHCVHDEPAVP